LSILIIVVDDILLINTLYGWYL